MTDEQLTERYFERASIMEFDGGMTRIQATKSCFAVLEKWCEKVGRKVPDAIRDDLTNINKDMEANGKRETYGRKTETTKGT